MIIAIDFDGTIVEHKYPDIGKEVPGAIVSIKRLQEAGAKIVLWTMRSNQELDEAISWLNNKGIILWDVNKNREQGLWTTSPKVYANLYIDDAAVGCPLCTPFKKRPYVDWKAIMKLIGFDN